MKMGHHVKIESTFDTTESVKMIKEEKLFDTAAISSDLSANIYNMKILKRKIQDEKINRTRFLIISHKRISLIKNPKTSIVFTLENKPGSLFKTLSVFSLREIKLTKIESRPIPDKPFENYFYIEFIGSIEDKKCKNAIINLSEISSLLKILGSYEVSREN